MLRPHSTDLEDYDDQSHTWDSIVDGETGTERAEIRAELGELESSDIVARLYGEPSRDRFEARLAELASDDPFVAAWQAVERGDRGTLAQLVDQEVGLLHDRGPDGAGLLDHAIWKLDQGDWSWPPGPAEDVAARLHLVELLVDVGADVEMGNFDGWRPLHSAAYIGWIPAIELLLSRGARVDRSTKGEGGTPLIMALFWGHRDAAERLAVEGPSPVNSRVAAGLGRRDLLATAPAEPRSFYRPHSGFPQWQPSDDPGEVRDEALHWACRSGRVEVLDAIGGDVDAEIGGAIPLLIAAGNGWTECVRWLLDRGADVQRTATQWRGATALHAAAWFGHLATVKLLVERGARLDAREPEHGGTPRNWAEHHGNHEIAAWLARRDSSG